MTLTAAGHGVGQESSDGCFEFSRPRWQEQAACKKIDPAIWRKYGDHPVDMFYPSHDTGRMTWEHRQDILSICGSCPVADECRQHAITHELYGFWGGIGGVKRSTLRKELGIRVEVPELDREQNKTIGTFHQPGHGSVERYFRHLRRDEDEPCHACKEAWRTSYLNGRGLSWGSRLDQPHGAVSGRGSAPAGTPPKRGPADHRHHERPMWDETYEEDPLWQPGLR